eukprot:6183376-Pleurochrysis_carterae.AAC.1
MFDCTAGNDEIARSYVTATLVAQASFEPRLAAAQGERGQHVNTREHTYGYMPGASGICITCVPGPSK